MRAILAFLCLFSGSPDNAAAESVDTAQEPKIEKYWAFLSELASPETASATKAPIDLPAGLKEAIEIWTGP
jgi:hypothetical protein